MANDQEILIAAYEHEHDKKLPEVYRRTWEYYAVKATARQIDELVKSELVELSYKDHNVKKYKLTSKGNAAAQVEASTYIQVPAQTIMEAMDLIVGFDDLKETIAFAIESRSHTHVLMEGPPACAKSLFLEALRSSVPGVYLAFGSRTSAAGISDALFVYKPRVLLLDECDKMEHDCFSVLLGLMEGGEVIETKSRRTRGVTLQTQVLAACNSSLKMSREFLSRFDFHPHFPEYTREEFIDVCRGFLNRQEGCPPEIAESIGHYVYDYKLGDVRKARGVWKLMRAPNEEEIRRVVNLMQKYGPENYQNGTSKKQHLQKSLL